MPFRVITAPRHAIGQPFATSVSANGRYLVDQYANPFLLVGASDSTITNISVVDMQFMMRTRSAQGFNFQLVSPIANQSYDSATGTPDWATFDGVVPFFKTDGVTLGTGPADYDVTQPNPVFWARIDSLFQAARQYGVTLLVTILGEAAYQTSTGFYAAQGSTKLATYATWFANRYAAFTYHHLWGFDHFTVSGMSYATSDPFITTMLNAVRAANPRCLHTIENNDGLWTVNTANLDLTSDDASWGMGTGSPKMDFNWMYDARDNSPDTVRAYNLGTAAPVFFGEGLFDSASPGKNTWSNLLNRKYLYFPVINGGCGSFYGHDTMWHYGTGWQTAILSATPIAHIGVWKAFMTSIKWWTLVPDSTAVFVSTGNSYSAGTSGTNAAVSADGSLGLAYLPANASVTVAMTKMRATVTAQWFDPTNGTYTSIGSFANTGTHAFTSSTNNAGGDPDWVLVLTA